MTTMPAEITYGHVTGRFIAAWTDGPDAGRLPDPRPLEGLTVKITPKVQVRRLAGASPVLVATMPVTCKVDADGRLIDEQGNPGVWLVTGVYGVTYAHPAVSIPAHDIEVTDAHTEAAPLDLVTAMPPGGPVLTPSQYAELSARIDILTPVIASLNGTGSPEGVIAANAGSTYIDTAATAGALEWTKRSGTGATGWRVTKGDTGWRSIPHSGTAGKIGLRRIGDIVYLRMSVTTPAVFASGDSIASMPTEFAPEAGVTETALYSIGGAAPTKNLAIGSSISLWSGPPTSSVVQASATSWSTTRAWPSTLPGTAWTP